MQNCVSWMFRYSFSERATTVLPLIPIAAVVATSVGAYILAWYHNLGKDEQAEADRLANQYALDLYQTGLDKLTAQQVDRVHKLVKGHFAA